jgi:adenylate kinase
MDATKKPLRIPPDFGVYAEEHGIFDLYKNLLCQLIIEKPTDPIQFTIDWLKRDNNDVSQIAVVGPPCSGKKGISSALCKKINAVHVSMDVLLDDELSDDATEAKQLIANSQPVPDDIWVKLICDRLKRKDCIRRGFVLEAFPKNRAQAAQLQSNGVLPKHVVVLDAPDTVLLERQAGKRVDPDTGDVYHTTFDWPQDPAIQERLVEPSGISSDETKAGLAEYARSIEGILASFPHQHKLINADQPKADVLAQTMTFINAQQRSVAPHTPRIILIGPTGCGKKTMANRLAAKYKLVNVSCGTLVKENIANETRLGEAVKEFVAKGEKVPDNLISRIVIDRLSQLDTVSSGWVLHGYPFNQDQAVALADANLRPNRVYFMDIPDDCVVERLSFRLTDPISGERFHTLYNPPRTSSIKQRCVQQTKDSEAAVRERIAEYHTFSGELTEYYMEEKFKAVRINADQDPQTVFEFIESFLVSPLPKSLGQD